MNKYIDFRLHNLFIPFLFIAMLWPQLANAQSCLSVFPDVASSYSSVGTIKIDKFSRLYDTDTILDVTITEDKANKSCETGACVSSGSESESLTLGSYNYTNSSQDITVEEDQSSSANQNSYDEVIVKKRADFRFLQNNTTTRLNKLKLDEDASAILDGGVYWIKRLELKQNSVLEINGSDKVIIYIEQAIIEKNVKINYQGDIDQLVIVAYNDVEFDEDSTMYGFLYVQNKLKFKDDSKFYGAFNAKTIEIDQDVDLYTRLADIGTALFDSTCSQNVTLPDPVHYYSMDMCSAPSGSDAINDDIGTNDGDAIGSMSIDYTAKYCQGAYFSGDRAFIDIPDPAAGNNLSEGTISLYFKTPDLSHSNYPSAGSMTLFSRDHNGYESGGHISLWLSDSGAIEVRQQSGSASHTLSTISAIVHENQWHHLAYTWGANGMRIYLDGHLKAQKSSYTGGFSATGREMAVGANSWTYNSGSSTSRTNQLKDFFIGTIDELKIFDSQLDASQISTLENVASQVCTNCSADPVLVAHWGADVCSFDANQLIDVESGINGVIRNGITNSINSRFCQGLSFDGNQSYATVDHNVNLQVTQGAISLWFNLSNLNHSNNVEAGGNALFSKDSINWANGDHVELRVDANGRIQVRHQEVGQSTTFGTSLVVVQENKWHHLVYSFGPSGAYIYVDGVQKHHENDYFNGIETNDDTLVFGASGRRANRGSYTASNFGDFMLGELDHIKVYRNQPSGSDVNDWFLEEAGPCSLCGTLMAEYDFDQANFESSTIVDNSGNGNSGVFGSSVSSALIGDNISCRSIELPTTSNTGSAYYFDTGIAPQDIGSQGSISFWYRAKEAWNDGTARQLFDASESVNNKYFFLVKKGDGALAFGLETADDRDMLVTSHAENFAANTWVHISVQWNLISQEFSIYLNGEEESTDEFNELVNATLPSLDSLVFGDSRSTYLVSPATGNAASGYIDDIRIYSQVISASQIQSDMAEAELCVVVDHYLIEHPLTSLTCDSQAITIKACANESCSLLSTNASTLVLTPDKFDGGDTITFTGQTVVTLNNQTSGTLTLGTSSQDPVAAVECSNNCDIEYESTGIQFFNKLTGLPSFDNYWFVAEQNLSNLGLKIVGDNGGTCEGIVNGQHDIELTYSCVNTVDVSYTPTQCNVPFAGISLSGGTSQTGTVSLAFDVNGEADFSAYNFADAGILNLSASATINNAAVQPSSTNLNIVPSYLSISSATGSTITAGVSIPFSMSAYGASNTLLPGFQSNDLEMSVVRTLPNDVNGADSQFYFDVNNGVTSSLTESFENITATYVAGVAQSNSAYFEEVGTYIVDVRDNDYLGTVIHAASITLGRVIPAYFDVQKVHQPMLQNTCNSVFTYVGETVEYSPGLEPTYTITAYNALGQITRNYTGDLWLLSHDIAGLANQQVLTDTSSYSGDGEQESGISSAVLSGTDVYDGTATLVLNGLSYSYPKVVAPSGNDASPFDANFEYQLSTPWFTDTDNVCYQDSYPNGCSAYTVSNITGANMRYGRLNMQNAFGPETETLAIPIYAEYLDAGQWRINTEDSCTPIVMQQSSADIEIIHDQQSTVNLATMLTNLSINSQLVTGVLPSIDFTVGPIMSGSDPVSGSFYIELAPKAVSGHWSNHLNYDWDGDGDIDIADKPSANVTLGIYRGNERTLHWREVLN